MSYKSIAEELPSCSLEELEKLNKKIQFLLKLKGGQGASPLLFIEEMFLESLRRLHVKPLALSVLRQRNPGNLGTRLRHIAEDILDLANYLELNQSGLVKLCSVVAEVAESALEKRGIAKDFRSMIYILGDNVDYAIDQEFPGWVAAGFFKNLLV